MKIELKAPAKLNLYLNILSKREDGYHELETIIQAITLFDKIMIEKLNYPGIYLEVRGPYKVPNDSTNLVYKAADIILKRHNIVEEGVKIVLEKYIPVGAGLGGGSSDATVVLFGLNRLFNLNLRREDYIEYGKLLGCDVVYFLYGKIALCKGIGTDVVLLPFRYDLWFILIFQNFQIRTSWAYAEFDLYGRLQKEEGLLDNIMTALKNFDLQSIGKNIYNSFEEVIYKYYPFLLDIKNALLMCGCVGAGLSGKGPTIFGLVENEEKALEVRELLRKRYKLEGHIVRAKNF